MNIKNLAVIILLSISVFAVNAQTEIKWMTMKEAQEASKKNPKKIFVDIYTDWCGWCKKMDATTFKDPKIVAYMNKNYYAVKFNAEQREPIVYNGKEYKFVDNGNRGYHELAYMLMSGRMSYPTTAYIDEKLNLLTPVPGFQEVSTLDMILKYFGDGEYLKMNWEEYQKKYTGN
jgi:thioredoxin-related protein